MRKLANTFLLIGALATALMLSACSHKPDVSIQNTTLNEAAGATFVHLSVVAYGSGTTVTVQPSKDAVLLDNLGNVYHVLNGDASLDGGITGALLGTHKRSGQLIFPQVDPKATLVSLSFPIYNGPSLGDAVLFGFSSNREPQWKASISWVKRGDKFVIGEPSVASQGPEAREPYASNNHNSTT